MGPEVAWLKTTFRMSWPTPLFVFKASVNSLTGRRNFPDRRHGLLARKSG
jgi:hypothetical protein